MSEAGGSTSGSSLPGGPEVSFAEPIWVAFYRPGIKKHWTGIKKRLVPTREALRQFFLESPDRPVFRPETKSMHFGQCNVVSLYDVGTHEYGLQIKGQEFIPFGFLEGRERPTKRSPPFPGGFRVQLMPSRSTGHSA